MRALLRIWSYSVWTWSCKWMSSIRFALRFPR
jgi:hypothetical protein